MDRLINPQTSFMACDIIINHLITTANYPLTPSAIRAQTCESISDIMISAMNVELSTDKDDHLTQVELVSGCCDAFDIAEDFLDGRFFESPLILPAPSANGTIQLKARISGCGRERLSPTPGRKACAAIPFARSMKIDSGRSGSPPTVD